MTFDEVWKAVKGLLDTAMMQVPGTLSDSTKKKLAKLTPEEVEEIISAAIEEVNYGSTAPLDELVKKRL